MSAKQWRHKLAQSGLLQKATQQIPYPKDLPTCSHGNHPSKTPPLIKSPSPWGEMREAGGEPFAPTRGALLTLLSEEGTIAS